MNIKRLLPFLFLGVMFSNCEQPKQKEEDSALEHVTEITIHNVHKDDLEILLIDKCEYIIYKESDGANRAYGFMSHKGNCKNPVHCHNTSDN